MRAERNAHVLDCAAHATDAAIAVAAAAWRAATASCFTASCNAFSTGAADAGCVAAAIMGTGTASSTPPPASRALTSVATAI